MSIISIITGHVNVLPSRLVRQARSCAKDVISWHRCSLCALVSALEGCMFTRTLHARPKAATSVPTSPSSAHCLACCSTTSCSCPRSSTVDRSNPRAELRPRPCLPSRSRPSYALPSCLPRPPPTPRGPWWPLPPSRPRPLPPPWLGPDGGPGSAPERTADPTTRGALGAVWCATEAPANVICELHGAAAALRRWQVDVGLGRRSPGRKGEGLAGPSG